MRGCLSRPTWQKWGDGAGSFTSARSFDGANNQNTQDDYVWLGGRPVAMVRGRLSNTWARQADSSTDCARNGEAADCGVYFPVTDHIGKPVLMLDGSGRVAGAAEHEPFGHVNRVALNAETTHPLDSTTVGTTTLASMVQPTDGTVSVKMRALFHLLDMNAGKVELVDGAAGSVLTSESGTGRARFWSQWVQPSTGRASVRVVWPDGVGGSPSTGVVLEAYEYQRYQMGTQPFWTPLRFPGQYHDVETDLFENWNRYYDASIGRYLQPEPMLQNPGFVKVMAERGVGAYPYAYAGNNPAALSDSSGLYVIPPKDPRFQELIHRLKQTVCGRIIMQKLEESSVHFLFDDGVVIGTAPGRVTVRQKGNGVTPDVVGVRLNFSAPIGGGSLFSFAHELGHALDYRHGVSKRIEHPYSPSCFRDNGRACQCRIGDPRDYDPNEEWADRIARCVTEGTFGGDVFEPVWN